MFKVKNTFAINFSDYSLEALELVHDKESYSIQSYSRSLIETGVIVDGKIVSPEKLKAAVKNLLAQAKPKPILAREVVFTLPESKVFVQTFSLPRGLSKQQVSSALFSQARETIPIDPTLMAADYREVSRRENLVEYLFAATYKDLIAEYLKFFQSLQLKVPLIAMESQALAAAIVDESKNESVLLLDIGSRTTIASLFKNGNLRETINIDIAGNNITAALAEKLKISQSEAEQMKISTGLSSENSKAGSELLIIQGQLQPLKDEILLFIKYYEDKTQESVSQVMAAGGTSSLIGLKEYLEANLGLPVILAERLPRFKSSLQPPLLAKFLVVLGAASLVLNEKRLPINFLARSDKDWQTPVKIAKIKTRHDSSADEGKTESDSDEVGIGPPKLITPKKKMTKRLIIAFASSTLALIGAAGIWWWQFGLPFAKINPPEIVDSSLVDQVSNHSLEVLPFSVGDEQYKNSVSFNFIVNTAETDGASENFAGSLKTIADTVEQPYDQGTVDYVTRRLQSELATEPTGEQVESGLNYYLISQTWADERDGYRFANAVEGELLLPAFYSAGLTLAWTRESEAGEGAMTLQMNLEFIALVLSDEAKYGNLKREQLAAFTLENPEAVLAAELFTYETGADNNIIVTATYHYN